MADDGTPHRFTLADHRDYTVKELRQLAREHGVAVRSRADHPELVAALVAAGVELPPKPPERISGKPLNRCWPA
jgi:hypothetical protein